jgi:hypothetical protein
VGDKHVWPFNQEQQQQQLWDKSQQDTTRGGPVSTRNGSLMWEAAAAATPFTAVSSSTRTGLRSTLPDSSLPAAVECTEQKAHREPDDIITGAKASRGAVRGASTSSSSSSSLRHTTAARFSKFCNKLPEVASSTPPSISTMLPTPKQIICNHKLHIMLGCITEHINGRCFKQQLVISC